MTPSTELVYQERFNKSLIRLFSDACRINRFNPSQCLFWVRTYFRQRSRAAARNEAGSEQLNIPPLLILSGTNRCNLNCKGCYASSRSESNEELSLERIESLFQEASDLGVGVIMITGGEPLMKPEILWMAGKQKEIIFPVFTNGILLNKGSISYFKHHKNLIPVLSIKGGRAQTDNGRGTGVYSQLLKRMEHA
jgi:MoaA/NifB/PqqE/SkfB family radical SAM enzyme